jgi:hypothetical protein
MVDGCGGKLIANIYKTGAITKDCAVSATFSKTAASYIVTSATTPGGTITPFTPRTVKNGLVTRFTVKPAAGYNIGSVTGCGGALAGSAYTTGPVTGACAVSAMFISAPAVTTGAVGGISLAGGAVINGLVNPGGLATTVYFDYGTRAAYGSAITVAGSVTGYTAQASSSALTGLTCGATYHYRVRATNAAGTSNGADSTFVACLSRTHGDFNGDGKSDIFFRDAVSGQTQAWMMNGVTVALNLATNLNAGAYTPTSGLQAQGIGDFDGDGKYDVLWRDAVTGDLSVWTMIDGAAVVTPVTGAVGPGAYTSTKGLQVQGIGDFNGDGKSDILFRNAVTGQTSIWFMNGAVVTSTHNTSVSAGAYTATKGWQMQAVGDFNGDGKADILWRDVATGKTYIWLMNEGVVTGGGLTSVKPGAYTGWQFQGVGDFDGDGKSDILWRDTVTGQTAVWFMNGTTVNGGGNTSLSPGGYTSTTGWQIQEVGDFDGDGKADILLRYAQTGQTAIWFMNGASKIGGGTTTSSAGAYTATTGWQVIRNP